MTPDNAHFWSTSDPGGLDLLTATFTDQVFARHTHEHYVIGINLDGVQGFERAGAKYVAPAGSIVVINPDDVHTGQAETSAPWIYRAFYPHPKLLSGVAAMSDPIHFRDSVVSDAAMFTLLRDAHVALEHSSDALVRSTLMWQALHSFCERYARPRPCAERPRRSASRVAIARSILLDRLHENISLGELAEAVGLSSYHLLRCFAHEHGLPPHLYRLQHRVDRAKHLLVGRMSIADIALASGFTDQSHLNRWFKRFVGVTPATYRRGVVAA